MPVHLVVEQRSRRLRSTEIKARAERMLSALQLKKAELSIVLTGDEQIHKLNKIYRKKDRPTDVLAFAMSEGEFGSISHAGLSQLLGDVIVSVETAARQATERDVTLLDEVTMLMAHGILHLLGWDHDTEAKDRAMRKETERLCVAASNAGRASSSVKGTKRRAQT